MLVKMLAVAIGGPRRPPWLCIRRERLERESERGRERNGGKGGRKAVGWQKCPLLSRDFGTRVNPLPDSLLIVILKEKMITRVVVHVLKPRLHGEHFRIWRPSSSLFATFPFFCLPPSPLFLIALMEDVDSWRPPSVL